MAEHGALESLDHHLARLAAAGWAWDSCPGVWTDICRAVEKIAREEAAAKRLLDQACSRWVERAPRFGGVAAHFPSADRSRHQSLNGARWLVTPAPWAGFVASFWAPEVFFGDGDGRCWYGGGGTRAGLDFWASSTVRSSWLLSHYVPEGLEQRRRYFWSPELPEVRVFHHSEYVRLRVFLDRSRRDSGAPDAWHDLFTRAAAVLALLLCLALPTLATPPPAFSGLARVVDGDTLEVAGEKIRLHGIDAPELAQTCRRASGAVYHCGWTAAVRLEDLIGGRPVRCLGAKRDRYKRLIATCYVVGERGPALDIGGALVVRGWAVAYRKYSAAYNSAEATAKAARAGMWAGSFVHPEEWRRGGGR